jgi:hypothetical protein
MSRQGHNSSGWEDSSTGTGTGRYDPAHTSLRGGSRPVTPASSLYADYLPLPPQRRLSTTQSTASGSGATSTRKKTPGGKKSVPITTQNLPHHKAGRVKVGIRIRPAFPDEVANIRGPFTPIITAQSASESPSGLGKVVLNVGGSKQREFKFDYAFGPKTTQDHVYDRVARPVVTDVLSGFNGTIFAYGKRKRVV